MIEGWFGLDVALEKLRAARELYRRTGRHTNESSGNPYAYLAVDCGGAGYAGRARPPQRTRSRGGRSVRKVVAQ